MRSNGKGFCSIVYTRCRRGANSGYMRLFCYYGQMCAHKVEIQYAHAWRLGGGVCVCFVLPVKRVRVCAEACKVDMALAHWVFENGPARLWRSICRQCASVLKYFPRCTRRRTCCKLLGGAFYL